MRTNALKLGLISMMLVGGCVAADAALTTNAWQVAGGKWENAANWNQGLPSLAHSANAIFGGVPIGGGIVGIDAATVQSHVINGCLLISNVVVGAKLGADFYTLGLTNTLNTPGNIGLTVLRNLTINAKGTLIITNSVLHVGSLMTGDGIFDDGNILLNTGTLVTSAGTVSVGNSSSGRMTMLNGTWQAYLIIAGNTAGSQGTLTIAGGIVDDSIGMGVGYQAGSVGTVWLTGGKLIQTNNSACAIGLGGIGQMTVSNGEWQSSSVSVGESQGTLTIAGGTNTFQSLGVQSFSVNGTGAVWMTGGQLLTPSGTGIGGTGVGQMTLSNGTWQTGGVAVGYDGGVGRGGTGTLTVAGGTATLSADLSVGRESNAVGAVWLTGGQLTVTNSRTYVGTEGAGRMSISNGNWLAREVVIGAASTAHGTLTVAGGQMTVTNGIGRIIVGGYGSNIFSQIFGAGRGRMSISGGSVLTRSICIACEDTSAGTLTAAGGTCVVSSNLTVGDCALDTFGALIIQGGSVFVTNATHDATLDFRSGWLLHTAGQLRVNKLVMTNECGYYFHLGGTLIADSLVLDPNLDADGDGLPNGWEQAHGLNPLEFLGENGADGDPDGDGFTNLEEYHSGTDPKFNDQFRINSISKQGNNIVLNWTTTGGSTNQVQVSPDSVGGSYSTNGFTNLGAQLFIPGSGSVTTNYTDTNGATNKPARYYRIRLVP